jgi:hypothetical protein
MIKAYAIGSSDDKFSWSWNEFRKEAAHTARYLTPNGLFSVVKSSPKKAPFRILCHFISLESWLETLGRSGRFPDD